MGKLLRFQRRIHNSNLGFAGKDTEEEDEEEYEVFKHTSHEVIFILYECERVKHETCQRLRRLSVFNSLFYIIRTFHP